MRERPIIMQAESVRAILAGTKTQTRRVIKPQPELRPARGLMCAGWAWDGRRAALESFLTVTAFSASLTRHSPYGLPGDRLWVKESLRRYDGHPQYDADGLVDYGAEWIWKRDALSPMFMPWGMRRLTLEVVEVRVQRVQEITHDDATAEGVAGVALSGAREDGAQTVLLDPVAGYRAGWDALNAKRGFPWANNPWVWAVTFRRVVA